ncbi:MAG: N-acetylmuramoyl-L-alanine amidase [Peptostreptococcaceae bacterium]
MLRVMIVSGHDFEKTGCVNTKLNVNEYKIVQRIINRVMDLENFKDVDLVYKARNASLNELPKEINKWNPDLAIEVHLNAANGSAQGSETLVWHTSKKGAEYGELFSKVASEKTGYRNRGILKVKDKENGCVFLKGTSCPAILIEPFFLDSIKDNAELDKAIENSAKAIIEFLAKIK